MSQSWKWLRQLFCAHRSTFTLTEDWGGVKCCDHCRKTWVWFEN